MGYHAVGDIARQHIRLDPGLSGPDTLTEAEVVNYADKRVKHEEVVDIDERFQDVLKRYANKVPDLQARFDKIQLETRILEEKIFSRIDISPEQVNHIISNPT